MYYIINNEKGRRKLRLTDYHFHTNLSPDADNSLEEMALTAYNNGLSEICVTDHCDEGTFTYVCESGRDFSYNEEESLKQYLSISPEIKEKINIKYGVELGEPCQNLKRANDLVDNNDFDFIIGSLHNLYNLDDFALMNFNGVDLDKLFQKYLFELEKHIKWNKFDVLGHFTYPLRYIYRHDASFDIKRYYNDISDLLKTLASNGKGIEFNTAGLRFGLKRELPDEDIIKIFKNAGGEIITIGSDAHRIGDMGKNIKDGVLLAKKCGFDYISIFNKRKPSFEKIDL